MRARSSHVSNRTVLLFMGAIASFVFREGVIRAASPPPATRLPVAIVILVCVIADVMCIIWIGVSLRSYEEADVDVGKKDCCTAVGCSHGYSPT